MMSLWLSYGLVLGCFSYFVQGQTVKSVEICLTQGLPLLKVDYICESQEMIHVISVLHQEASPSCDPVPGGCQVLLESSADGLTTECNGQQTCTTDITAFRLKQRCENINASLAKVSYECIKVKSKFGLTTNCNGRSTCPEDVTSYTLSKTCDFNITTSLVTVSYECVKEQPIKMCSVRHAQATTTLYLTSPSFPRGTGSDIIQSNGPCNCTITGTAMSVNILEVYFLNDPQLRANLTLEGDNDVWDTTTTSLMYNTLVVAKTSHIKLTYDAVERNGQDAWIRMKGFGNITVDCNPKPATLTTAATTSAASTTYGETTTTATNAARQSNSVVTNLLSPTTVHVDTTTISNGSLQSDGPDTVGIAVGCVIGVLVVAAVVIVIVCLITRKNRSNQYLSSKDDDEEAKQYVEDYERTLANRDASDSTLSDNGHGPSSSPYSEIDHGQASPLYSEIGHGQVSPPYSEIGHGQASPPYSEISHGPQSPLYADVGHGQPSPVYFELEKLGTQIDDNGQAHKIVTKANSRESPSKPKSNLPYTSKRLEELYSRVIPKKFRSTRDMREVEKKGKRKSNNSSKGTDNDTYDNAEVNSKAKNKSKKDRNSSKGDPDYQEISPVAGPQCESDVSPPVPPKAEGLHGEEAVKEEKIKHQNNCMSSEDSKTKHRKKKSSSSITVPVNPSGQCETRDKSENDLDQRDGNPFPGDNTTPEGDAKRDSEFVMVDNVLYEGSSPAQNNGDNDAVMVNNVLYEGSSPSQEGPNGVEDKSRSGQTLSQVIQGSHYEDINDESMTTKPHVSGDVRPGRPAAYEEIII